MVVVEVALEQGTLNGCLMRRLAQLREVRLARREALELVSLRALPACRAHPRSRAGRRSAARGCQTARVVATP